MANQGAKKRREENRKHMRNLFRLIVFCGVCGSKDANLPFQSHLEALAWPIFDIAWLYLPVSTAGQDGKPAFDESGELLDGGHDMSGGGVCGYLHDIIYITSFVQLMSIISGKFWYIYLVIPAFAVYQLSGLIRAWFSQGSEGQVEDEKARKKREKMEKKASRPKFAKTRNKRYCENSETMKSRQELVEGPKVPSVHAAEKEVSSITKASC